MTLRLAEVVLPRARTSELESLLNRFEIVDAWVAERRENRSVVCILLPADLTEAVLDALEERFSGHSGFHVVLIPIEAVLLRVVEPEESTNRSGALVAENKRERRMLRISRGALLEDIGAGAQITPIYIALATVPAVVAAVGLVRDNVAILVRAMVIAPLLVPNAALALARMFGDVQLVRRTVKTNAVGTVAAPTIAVVIGFVLPFEPQNEEIASRCVVSLGDVVLALVAGVAGTISSTTGMATGLIDGGIYEHDDADACSAIARRTADDRLLVMGAYVRSKLQRMALGSVTAAVIRAARGLSY